MLDSINSLFLFLFTVGLGSERLITIVKTALPNLGKESMALDGKPDPERDKGRRLQVLALALIASYISVSLVTGQWNPLESVPVGTLKVNVTLLSILGSGGSAFWNNFLGYSKALKDVKREELGTITTAGATSVEDRVVAGLRARGPKSL